MRYYLAYGSNLNKVQMNKRCPNAKVVGKAILKNHELLFKGSKTGSYLTVEETKGRKSSWVPVGIWEVDENDEKALDRYEGYPIFYRKEEMEVTINGEWKSAFIYIMNPQHGLGIPSDSYWDTCIKGYRYFGFDKRHLDDALRLSKEQVYGKR